MIERALEVAVEWAWGWPLVILLVGGGTLLTLASRLLPFVGLRHAIDIVRGYLPYPFSTGRRAPRAGLS